MKLQLREELQVADPTEVSDTPENRLMLAVLEEAILTFQTGLKSKVPLQRRHFCEVASWISSRESDWPFSFECICTSLQLDPDYIRAGLMRMKRRVLQQSAGSSRLRIKRASIHDRKIWRGHVG